MGRNDDRKFVGTGGLVNDGPTAPPHPTAWRSSNSDRSRCSPIPRVVGDTRVRSERGQRPHGTPTGNHRRMELPGEVRLVADNRIEAGTIEQHVRFFSPLCSCKLRLRRASPTVGLPSGDRALLGLRRLHAGGAKTCSYKLILCLRLLLARSGNGKSQSSSDPIACDEDALSGIDPRRGVRDLQRKKRLVGRGAAVSSGSQHGDGLEELEPTDRDDATAATRRRFGLATIVPLDAG